MKKRIITTLLFLCFFALNANAQEGLSSFSTKYTGDLPLYKISQTDLNGKVRSIVVKSGEGEEKFGDVSFTDYDNVTLIVYSVNENGYLMNITNFGLIGGDRTVKSKEVFLYDNKNRLSKIEEYDADGSCSRSYQFQYNQNNVVTSAVVKNGLEKDYMEWDYDKNGNHVKTRYYDGYGNLTDTYISECKYTYYDNGKVKTITDYYDNQPVSSNTLDTKGRIIEAIVYKEGVWKRKIKYSYNQRGFPSGYEMFNIVNVEDNLSVSYKYVFDNQGNPIKAWGVDNDNSMGNTVGLRTYDIDYW